MLKLKTLSEAFYNAEGAYRKVLITTATMTVLKYYNARPCDTLEGPSSTGVFDFLDVRDVERTLNWSLIADDSDEVVKHSYDRFGNFGASLR